VTRSRLASTAGVLGGAIVFVLAWKLIVVLGDWKPFVLPPPESVGARFLSAWADGTIGPNAAATLLEVVLGFTVGATTAVLLGYLLARSGFAERVLSPYVVAAQSTPILALAQLFAIWFGTGLVSKVVMCSLIVFFPVAVATMVGIREVDRSLIEMSRAFRATRLQRLLRIEIPGAMPSIFGGLRVGATLAVVGAVVAEWAGADNGLGVLLLIAKGSRFDMPLALATLATIAALGVACYLVVVIVERRLVGARG
jgi:NitT/TauT family transport system permease protein